ncbi:hypothetical protein DIPPA_01241 [Diplonema papillatum]|nr:hypothetical protein DIPPA_01241 [Diplonema papillatum]
MKDAGPVIELTEDPRPWWLAPAQTSSRQCPECGETMHVDRLAKFLMSLSHYFVVAVPCAHGGAAVPASGWLKISY